MVLIARDIEEVRLDYLVIPSGVKLYDKITVVDLMLINKELENDL